MLSAIVALILTATSVAPSIQQIGYTEHQRLPSFRSPADHATLDANAFGDVVVAFHAGPYGDRSVEAVVIQAVSPGIWESDASTHFLLGDPALNVFGANDDSCIKPAVAALDDGSFAIVWPRKSDSQPTLGRLEAARIVVRDAQGVLLPLPIVETAALGEGFIVDPNVPAGGAGLMPDLVALPGKAATAVYASEDWIGFGGSGETYREYSLRLTRMDWNAGGGTSQFVSGPWIIASGVPIDNPWWDPYFGGTVLPDLVADDLGNLVVAWEDYLMAGHPGYSGPMHRGRIQVRRFEALSSAQPLRTLDQITFRSSVDSTRHLRRPVVSSSPADAANDVLLVYMEEGSFPDMDLPHVKRIHFPSSMATDQATTSDGYWVNDPTRDESHVTCGMMAGREIVLANRYFWNKRPIYASDASLARSLRLRSAVSWTLRPAVTMISLPDGAGGFQDTMFMSYEGDDVDDRNRYHIYFVALRL